jgi:glycosyltransferase involved in cell wall biosynthesis
MKVLKLIPKLNSDSGEATKSLEGISVAIPHYNCQNYLLETLDSVHNAKVTNMEIFVVDDQTPDFNLREFLDAHGYRDVRAYINSKNLGSFATFNECIKHANHKLVHVLHADDIVKDNFYEEVYRTFDECNDLDAFFCAAEIIDHQSRSLSEISPVEPLEVPYELNFLSQNPIRTPAVVVKRSAFKKVGLYRIDLPHTADWDLWIRLILRCKVQYSHKSLCKYRVFSESRTNLQRKQGKAWYGTVKLQFIIANVYKVNIKRFRVAAQLSLKSILLLTSQCYQRSEIGKIKFTLYAFFYALLIAPALVPLMPVAWILIAFQKYYNKFRVFD